MVTDRRRALNQCPQKQGEENTKQTMEDARSHVLLIR